MTYLYLFYEFFKIGLFSIGGGLATIPFLLELPSKYDWYSTDQLANMIAISESTPGPIGVNMATFAGYHAGGILGALIATLALVAPALIIITLIAKFLENFSESPIVKAVFYGVRPTVAALIGYAVFELIKITLFTATTSGYQPDYTGILLCAIIFFLLQWKVLEKLHPIIWMIGGACVGVILKL